MRENIKMRSFLLLFITIFSCKTWAEINLQSHEFSFEYGLAYHTLRGEQKDNASKGRLTSPQYPYWSGGYTKRLGRNFGLRAFGGVQFVRFDEPEFGTLKNERQVLNQFGLELISKTSALSKTTLFLMQQDHPLYYAKGPSEFEVIKRSFLQSGAQFSIGQRRRIGMLWGMALKGFFIFPTKGGNLATEAGAGAEAQARLGWVGPLGTLYQIKGFYEVTSAPNAEVTFTHEILGYCLLISHSF
jgi:hypothetical protein